MPAKPVFRRRQYIIKKGLQFRYIGLVFGLALLASLVTGWTVFATAWHFLGDKLASVYPQGRLVYVLRATNLALIRNLLLISPLVFILGLLFSHKIAGPMYRFEKSAEAISKGNLCVNFYVRKGDEMKHTAITLEEMLESLRSDIAKLKKLAEEKKVEEISAVLSKYKICE